jgi:hypothetical protein
MTKYGRAKAYSSAIAAELPPAAFDEDVTVVSVLPSRGNPYGMLARWFFPTSRLPRIRIAVPAVISTDPDMSYAWPDSAVLVNTYRRPKLHYYLRVSGCHPQGESKKRGKNQFSHLMLLYLQ